MKKTLKSESNQLNIIVNGFHNRSHFKVVERICRDFKVQYVAHVFSKEIFPLPKGTKGDFFDYEEVLYYGNYSLDLEELTPLDAELVEQMKPTESVVLNMMTRLEKYKSYGFNSRREIYLQHLKVWNHIIQEKRIGLFISSNVPHLVFDYIIYDLCRMNKIPAIILKQTQIHGVFTIFSSWEKFRPSIKARYCHYLKQKEVNLSTNFAREYQKQTGQDAPPFYMKKTGLSRRVARYLKTIINERRWGHRLKFGSRQALTGLNIAFRTRHLMGYYERIATRADFSKKYIYLPLHLQPEMTTSPCAGVFADQSLMIELLASVLPRNYYLYVKENPKQTTLMRSRQYYQRIKKLKRVVLISRKENTFNLINHSTAVATATGTAGWESLFRGKSVIMFGYDFYQYAPGVIKVESLEDAKRAIEFIQNQKNLPSLKQMKAFLKAYETVCTVGFVDPVYAQAGSISHKQNEINLIKTLENYMIKLGFKIND